MHYIEAKSILSAKNGMNIYRGCMHGCIYCDSRSSCYGFKHNFEDIEVKINAPELLEKTLSSKRKPCMIGTGSMCDPYLPIEKDLKLTRHCLEIIDRYECGIATLTKSSMILRDMDIYKSINKNSKAVILITLTTYDEDLCKIVEPNVSTTKERFETLLRFKEENIPTVVWLCPLLPYINDTKYNLEGILNYCIKAGVKGIVNFGMGLTLREGSREYYYKALDNHFPSLKDKYLKEYGNAYEVPSKLERELSGMFRKTCLDNDIMYKPNEIFTYLSEYPKTTEQLSFL